MKLVKYELELVKDKVYDYQVDGRAYKINSPDDVYKLLREVIELHKKAEEECWCICLDNKLKPIGLHLVSRGSINSSIVHPREVFKRALLNNSANIIIAHNHPSGETNPSQEDVNITQRLLEAGKVLGIELLDHMIIGEFGYTSLKEKGLI